MLCYFYLLIVCLFVSFDVSFRGVLEVKETVIAVVELNLFVFVYFYLEYS